MSRFLFPFGTCIVAATLLLIGCTSDDNPKRVNVSASRYTIYQDNAPTLEADALSYDGPCVKFVEKSTGREVRIMGNVRIRTNRD